MRRTALFQYVKCDYSNIVIVKMTFDSRYGEKPYMICSVYFTSGFITGIFCKEIRIHNVGTLCLELNKNTMSYLQTGEFLQTHKQSESIELKRHLGRAIQQRQNICVRSAKVLLLYIRKMYGKDVTQKIGEWIFKDAFSWEWEKGDFIKQRV